MYIYINVQLFCILMFMYVHFVVHYYVLSLFLVRKEVESLQRSLQEKSEEISSLHKQLSDMERDKHTEIVKLRLEVRVCI